MGKIVRISESERIIEKLRAEGKVKTIEFSAEQQQRWDELMEEIRRESRYKQAMSAISASKTFFTS